MTEPTAAGAPTSPRIFFSKSTLGFYDDSVHVETQIPMDAVEITPALRQDLLASQRAGKLIAGDGSGMPVAVEPPPLTPGQVQAALSAVVQAHLDAQAKLLGYDSIATAVTYADEPAVPKFEAEGKALRAWRSQVWGACTAQLDAVLAGTVPVPTTAALIASMPVFTAP